MTRDELRECMKLEARVKEDNQALRARQRDTDAAKDEIAKRTSALRERVAGLDRSDAAAVESAKSEGEDIDRASDRYNAGLPDLDRRTRAAAAQQADWKARCSGKPYDERDYYAIKRGK